MGEIMVEENPFSLKAYRKNQDQDDSLFFELLSENLILSDEFLQVSIQQSSEFTFGIGENGKQNFKRKFDRKTWPIWARDWATNPENEYGEGTANFYGHQMMMTNLDYSSDGSQIKSNYIYLHNSAASEVQFNPGAVTVIRSIGGIIDMVVGVADRPEEGIIDYTSMIGKPLMPTYWALGYHLCRWGYTGTEQIENIHKAMKDANFPLDVQWVDIDYMDNYFDFTIGQGDNWKNLPALVDKMHDNNVKLVTIVDPGIKSDSNETYPTYDRGLEQDIYIKTAEGENYQTLVWPGYTYHPDFSNPKSRPWWSNELDLFQISKI